MSALNEIQRERVELVEKTGRDYERTGCREVTWIPLLVACQ